MQIPSRNLVSMDVYLDFHKRGYRIGGAYYHFDEMQNLKTKIVPVSNEDLKRISLMLNKTTPHKMEIILFGVNNLFCLAHFDDLLCKIVIAESEAAYYFVDLTRKIEFEA